VGAVTARIRVHGKLLELRHDGRIVGVDDADLEIIRQARFRHMVERNGAQGRLGDEAVRACRFSRRDLELDCLITSGNREMVILDREHSHYRFERLLDRVQAHDRQSVPLSFATVETCSSRLQSSGKCMELMAMLPPSQEGIVIPDMY
jgi:hypothetical protein